MMNWMRIRSSDQPGGGWRTLAVLFAAALIGGCGVETATTAATGAAIKQREVAEGKKTQDSVRQKVDQAMDQAQQRTQAADAAAEK